MNSRILSLFLCAFFFVQSSCSHPEEEQSRKETNNLDQYKVAYFAAGCFWCVEAIFESIKGVKEVISGYSGGSSSNANYKVVSTGKTDHAETVAIYYDPSVIDYKTLLIAFFGSHDPTTLNRQGPDRGRQYRSAIFYQTENEKKLAESYIASLLDTKRFSRITTEVVPFDTFYIAESYHQNYKERNPNDPYVKNVSEPRLQLFKERYPELLEE